MRVGKEAIFVCMTNTQYLKEIRMEAARAPELPACQIASLSGIYFRPTSAQREDGKSWKLPLKIRDGGEQNGKVKRKAVIAIPYIPELLLPSQQT